jgi:hypothetical protein
LVRVRKFDSWFVQFNQGEYLKIDNSIHDAIQNIIYHNSLIIKIENPFKDEIIDTFNSLINGLDDEKPL